MALCVYSAALTSSARISWYLISICDTNMGPVCTKCTLHEKERRKTIFLWVVCCRGWEHSINRKYQSCNTSLMPFLTYDSTQGIYSVHLILLLVYALRILLYYTTTDKGNSHCLCQTSHIIQCRVYMVNLPAFNI